MSYFLRHKPQLTFDIDFWVENSEENLSLVEACLTKLEAEWGKDDKDWKKVSMYPKGWIKGQSMFSFSSPYGAIDIFREVRGLNSWQESFAASVEGKTKAGASYRSISDEDLLKCQLALNEKEQKADRIKDLKEILKK